jgi:hypothetical protein
MVADTMVRLGRFEEALPCYNTARRAESSATTRKQLARKIADVRETLRIQRLNTTRRPVLHEALEQDRVVRPRLIARASPEPKPAVKGGRKP